MRPSRSGPSARSGAAARGDRHTGSHSFLAAEHVGVSTPSTGLRSVANATFDLLFAAFGLGLLLLPGAVGCNAVFGEPLPRPLVERAVAVVALGGSYPFVAGDWPLRRLGDTLVAFVGGALAAGVIGAVTVIVLGLNLAGSDPRPQFAVVAVGYLVAFLLVHRRERSVLPSG